MQVKQQFHSFPLRGYLQQSCLQSPAMHMGLTPWLTCELCGYWAHSAEVNGLEVKALSFYLCFSWTDASSNRDALEGKPGMLTDIRWLTPVLKWTKSVAFSSYFSVTFTSFFSFYTKVSPEMVTELLPKSMKTLLHSGIYSRNVC